MVFVLKKDEDLRFCEDYIWLNAVTVQDSYLIPRIDEFIDLLGKAQMFSNLDADLEKYRQF